MAGRVLREHRRPARPRAGAHLQGSVGEYPLTFLFLVCTLAGWLLGTLAGWLGARDPAGGSVGGILGLSLGVALTVWLERRGGSTVANDHAGANFGLVWVAYFMGLLGVLWMAYGTNPVSDGSLFRPGWSLVSAREACLIMPILFGLQAAWLVKVRRTRGGVITYLAVLGLWTALTTGLAALSAHGAGLSVEPLLQTAAWSFGIGCIPALLKFLLPM